MQQGGQRIDPRLGRILAEIHNRFQNVAIAGDDDFADLLMTVNNAADDASSHQTDDRILRSKLLDIAVGSMALIASIDRTAELEFHRNRLMFYIIGDLMMVGVLGDERSHREWMKDEGDGESYEEAVRGYADETGVYAYKGSNFTLPEGAVTEFKHHFPALVSQMNLGADLEVWAGVVPGIVGTRWPGRLKLGTVAALMGW